ncbi:MAG: IS66 family transposase [Planctomycetes bacterium]|nr:IS66 family transposase [Planctomycetota bacterium]
MGEKGLLNPATIGDDPAELRAALVQAIDLIKQLKQQNEQLTHYLVQLRRWQFGTKSERLPEGQQIFAFYGTLEAARPSAAEESPASHPTGKRNGHGRRVIPPELPRRVILHDLGEKEKRCPDCKKMLRQIGQEIAEQLEYHPASMHVLQHVRLKYACGSCEGNVRIADPATGPILKGLAGPGLLAHLLVSKYDDHLPLYRQSEIFARQGVVLPRSTLCGWVGESVGLLKPIVEAMKKDILSSRHLKTDDTPVRYLDPESDKARQGRVWAYVGDRDHHQVVYEFTTTREQKWPKTFLGSYQGTLQADAYKGYDQLYVTGSIVEVACMAHVRRKFFEALETDRERASMALAMIGKLYEIERIAKDLPSAKRKALRQERARPILDQFGTWMQGELLKILPKSPIGQAIQYARAQWTALNRYVDDGDLNIDNNECERLLRGVCVGKKNYLFFGSEGGGAWAAIIYSLIESCKLNKVDPFAYVRDVLVRVSTHPTSRIEKLMPRLWKPPPQTKDSS